MTRLLPGWLALMLLAGSFLLVAEPARGQDEPEDVPPSAAAVDERAPVEVPEPSAQAMAF